MNVEFEHIGACIVTAWIKFHFCCSRLAEVEVGNNEFLLIPDGVGQEFAEGINDAAAAAADNLGQAIDFLFGEFYKRKCLILCSAADCVDNRCG